MARMIGGFPSIKDSWNTRDPSDHVWVAAEVIQQSAYEDIGRCLHFTDNWDETDVWDDKYVNEKVEASAATAHHRRKFCIVEDAFNRRWKSLVVYGKHETLDESRIAGWYKGPIMMGPEPKPIRTGATLHSLCVTFGLLATYKLHVRTYGGKSDEDISRTTSHTGSTQKWVNLLDEMLDEFKGKGHCVTMDSAYMGDILAQIGREEWKYNMVGTAQPTQTGALVKENVKDMARGTYDTVQFQHKKSRLSLPSGPTTILCGPCQTFIRPRF